MLINGSQGPGVGPQQVVFIEFKQLIHAEIQKYLVKEETTGRNNFRKMEFLRSMVTELNQIWDTNSDFDSSRGFCSRTLAFRQ